MHKGMPWRDIDKEHNQPKIGLALGSGGARGLAHIGILKVLTEHSIPIDYVAGSSIGALVGSMYCVGLGPEKIAQIITRFPQKYWLDYTVPKLGFIVGDKIKELVRLLTKGKKMEDTIPPLAVVATNLKKGERKIFREGPIAEAVRASISIPGIFVPEKINGEYFIDGGVIDRVPASVVKEMGADLVIAVDVCYLESAAPITSIFDVIAQSIDIMEREILNQQMIFADVMLRPEVGHYNTLMFSKVSEIIAAGEQSAQEAIPQIKALIQEWKGRYKNEHSST